MILGRHNRLASSPTLSLLSSLLFTIKISQLITASSQRLFNHAPELNMNPEPVYSAAEEFSSKPQGTSLRADLRSHKVSNYFVSYAFGD